MKVTKAKFRGEKVEVDFTLPNGNHFSTGHFECPDQPKQPFLDALEAMGKDVVNAIGIKGKAFVDRVRVSGVSVHEDRNGRRSFVFPFSLETPVGTIHTATPRFLEPMDDGEGTERVLSDIATKRVDAFLEAVVRYVSGTREQTELDLDGSAEAAGG